MLMRRPGALAVLAGAAATALLDGQRLSEERLRDENENHDPANGQFSSGEGGGGAGGDKAQQLAGDLTKHEMDNEKFDKTVEKLRGESKETVRAAATQYLGRAPRPGTSKADMVKAITNRQMVTVRQSLRAETIASNIKPW